MAQREKNMSKPREECPTVLVSDAPAKVDRFGTFSAVVEALVELIRKDPGGYAIGIEGNWGAGKSTVIRLLEEMLRSISENIEMVQFDAWAHQGDPLRRSFLELLTESLSKKGWLSSKKKEQVENQLSRRSKTEHKMTSPVFTRLGAIIAIGGFFIPVGISLFNSALRDGLTWVWSGWAYVSLKAIGGFILSINPILLFVCGRIYQSFTKKGTKEDTEEAEVESWSALILRKYSTKEITKTISDPNPTSVEFESIFRDILNNAITDHDRKLVIVLDNLDRVEPSDTITMLSTMHTFLQESFIRAQIWSDRVWILIPYSPDGIRKVWEERITPMRKFAPCIAGSFEGKTSQRTRSELTEACSIQTTEGQTLAPGLAERFLEKRFNVRFQVPPIALSDWGDYLEVLLAEALPDHPKTEDEFHKVYRVFDLTRPWSHLPPTPRDLKLFVNQIGSLHRQWHDQHPLPCLAYFATLFLRRKDVLNGLRDGSIPEPKVARILGVDAASTIASILFNAEKKKADELILKPDVVDALVNANSEKLTTLLSNHPSGFWYVLGRIVFREWSDTDIQGLANAWLAIDSNHLLDQDVGAVKQTILSELEEAFLSVIDWSPFGSIIGESIAKFITMRGDIQLATQLIGRIVDVDKYEKPDGSDQFDDWYSTFLPVFESAWDLPPEKSLPHRVSFPANVLWLLKMYSHLASGNGRREYAEYIYPQSGASEVIEHLLSQISSGDLNTKIVSSFPFLDSHVSEMEWTQIADSISQRINTTAAYEPEEIASLLRALWGLTKIHSPARSKLQNEVNRGQILHHIHHMRTRRDDEAVAVCLFTQIGLRPDPSPPPSHVGNSNDGWGYLTGVLSNPNDHPGLIKKYAALVQEFDKCPDLVQVADKAPQWKDWVYQALSLVINDGSALEAISTDDFLSKYRELKQKLTDNAYSRLTQDLIADGAILDRIVEASFDHNSSELYHDLLISGSESRLIPWIVQGLKNLDDSTWHNALSQETFLLDLTVETYTRGGKYSLGIAYRDGIKQYAQDVIAGTSTPGGELITSGEIYKPIWGKDRNTLRRKLLDIAIDARGNIPEEYFIAFGSEIAQTEDIGKDREVVLRLFEPLVESMHLPGMIWLEGLLSTRPEILEDYEPKHALKELRDRVVERHGKTKDPEFLEVFERIAGHLGSDLFVE